MIMHQGYAKRSSALTPGVHSSSLLAVITMWRPGGRLYGVAANGLRAGSGFTVGLLGAATGLHWAGPGLAE
jgi:hypothetical protein